MKNFNWASNCFANVNYEFNVHFLSKPFFNIVFILLGFFRTCATLREIGHVESFLIQQSFIYGPLNDAVNVFAWLAFYGKDCVV